MTAPERGKSGMETYYASKKSPLAKNRIYIWAGLAMGMVPVTYMQLA